MQPSRRDVLSTIGAASVLPILSSCLSTVELTAAENDSPLIATNSYPWFTFARRDDRAFDTFADQQLSKVASTGIKGYEPIVKQVADVEGLADRLSQNGLTMRSIYVNSTLHDESKVQQSMQSVLEIASAAAKLGVQIIVTNPAPIRWGSDEDKSDAQLRQQAKSLDQLGAALRKQGQQLAYHNHDAELRQGGREFHHMLTATDPANVKLCLDAHWIFRGCGDSAIAVQDAVSHYHQRIVELHLRQSTAGVWNEVFAMKSDLDYTALLAYLAKRGITPHLVLEQAIEEKTPKALSAVEAHRQSQANLLRAVS